jgi:hypothetical protein
LGFGLGERITASLNPFEPSPLIIGTSVECFESPDQADSEVEACSACIIFIRRTVIIESRFFSNVFATSDLLASERDSIDTKKCLEGSQRTQRNREHRISDVTATPLCEQSPYSTQSRCPQVYNCYRRSFLISTSSKKTGTDLKEHFFDGWKSQVVLPAYDPKQRDVSDLWKRRDDCFYSALELTFCQSGSMPPPAAESRPEILV